MITNNIDTLSIAEASKYIFNQWPLGIPKSTLQTWIQWGVLEPFKRAKPNHPSGHGLCLSDLVWAGTLHYCFALGIPRGALMPCEGDKRSWQRSLEAHEYMAVLTWDMGIKYLALYDYSVAPGLEYSNPLVMIKINTVRNYVVSRWQESPLSWTFENIITSDDRPISWEDFKACWKVIGSPVSDAAKGVPSEVKTATEASILQRTQKLSPDPSDASGAD